MKIADAEIKLSLLGGNSDEIGTLIAENPWLK